MHESLKLLFLILSPILLYVVIVKLFKDKYEICSYLTFIYKKLSIKHKYMIVKIADQTSTKNLITAKFIGYSED